MKEQQDATRIEVTALGAYSPLASEYEYTAQTLGPIQVTLESITPPLTLDAGILSGCAAGRLDAQSGWFPQRTCA
jgi:hypothetical protein